MASSYALPASAMTHSHEHHGHNHFSSHSLSPTRQNASEGGARALKTERSNGSKHSHSHSSSGSGLDQYANSPPRERHREPLSHLPSPPDSSAFTSIATFEKQRFDPNSGRRFLEPSPDLTHVASYEPPINSANVLPEKGGQHRHEHIHQHNGSPAADPRSKFTSMVLPLALKWPLLHTILSQKDSRRIFYFMRYLSSCYPLLSHANIFSLNFAFMVVQAFYGYITNSLGLLSDSIHMFFDCLALGVGLFASIASNWPPSQQFPYGFGKIESLSGFGNGVFLMLISTEIMIEAIERLAEHTETKRLGELFVVSGLGLVVNLVGMACFGHHGHAGHDHGSHNHGHSHSHNHSNSHSHSHSHLMEKNFHDCHNHDHDHGHGHGHGHTHHDPHHIDNPPSKSQSHGGHAHSHSHENENMHGIFLHVLADTMGSAAVMVSTLLIHFTGFNGWDPIASCIIAILIFMSSIPLIKSSAKKLLLTIPDETEYNLRETLGGLGDLRGVASYSVPKFWLGDKNTDSESEQVLGIIHIVATRGSDLEDVRERVRDFFLKHGVDAVIQVEKDGDTTCWCGGAAGSRSPSLY